MKEGSQLRFDIDEKNWKIDLNRLCKPYINLHPRSSTKKTHTIKLKLEMQLHIFRKLIFCLEHGKDVAKVHATRKVGRGLAVGILCVLVGASGEAVSRESH